MKIQPQPFGVAHVRHLAVLEQPVGGKQVNLLQRAVHRVVVPFRRGEAPVATSAAPPRSKCPERTARPLRSAPPTPAARRAGSRSATTPYAAPRRCPPSPAGSRRATG